MANGTRDDDIRDVIAEEKSRGKRPHDAKARKRKTKSKSFAEFLRRLGKKISYGLSAS